MEIPKDYQELARWYGAWFAHDESGVHSRPLKLARSSFGHRKESVQLWGIFLGAYIRELIHSFAGPGDSK